MSSPVDILGIGIVCGLAEPLRSNRGLLMLKVYIDDSGLNQPPVYVLAGWMAPVSTWISFSDDWGAALSMRPRIGHFKLSEAMNDAGEFRGISEESRDEKLRILAKVIEDHNLTGVSAIVPHQLFQNLFSGNGFQNLFSGNGDRQWLFGSWEKVWRNPYYFLVFGLISAIYKHQSEHGITEKIEFVFDRQVESEDLVSSVWADFRSSSPKECQDILGTINFRDDRDVLPIQAADFCAGSLRLAGHASVENKKFDVPWAGIGSDLNRIDWILTPEMASRIYQAAGEQPNVPMNPVLTSVWRALLDAE